MFVLAKLRAIEHRIGVILLAGQTREVMKTNRYKNIQRFREEHGRFGVDAAWLGGTRSVATGNKVGRSWQGIPPQFFDDYLALVNAER